MWRGVVQHCLLLTFTSLLLIFLSVCVLLHLFASSFPFPFSSQIRSNAVRSYFEGEKNVLKIAFHLYLWTFFFYLAENFICTLLFFLLVFSLQRFNELNGFVFFFIFFLHKLLLTYSLIFFVVFFSFETH